jgi:hypothetical protein
MRQDRMVWEKTGKEMMRIPAGKFLYGGMREERELPEFWIDRTPVTNAEYKRFLDVNPGYPVPFAGEGWAQPYNWDGRLRTFPPRRADHAVVLVAWYDAETYAGWAGARLPVEEEWKKAARGTDGREYPWGSWEEGRCNTVETRIYATTPAGLYSPHGDSPYGCADMAGNVWEWTATEDASGRVVRGGSFVNDRFQSAYELARIIGAQHLVLHTGYIPKTYPRHRWVENSVAFWVDFLSDKRGGMGFHLENVYEDDCSMMSELLDTVNEALQTDALTACLDVGHVNANSSKPFEEWIEGLGGRIQYVHMHNNDGVLDDHFGLWRGKIDVVNVLDLLMKHSPDAV